MCQNEDTLKVLKAAGAYRIFFGVESGDEAQRREVLDRQMTDKSIQKAFDNCHKNGLETLAVNIIGFPDETRDLVFETVELNRKIKDYVFQINAYYFVPYHGSPLRQICLDKGYITEDEQVTHITRDTILNSPYLSREEIRGLVRTFTLYTRFPKNRWKDIRIAENFDTKGNEMFANLQKEYWHNYL